MRESSNFTAAIIARGTFIDKPYGGNDDHFIIEAITLQLNCVALNEYFGWQLHNTRDCYEDGEAGDREWEEHKAEHKAREVAWREKIIAAIGIQLKPEGESLCITQAQSEVFTAVYTRKIILGKE